MTNKYVHKKWADNDNWSNDPAWLYENKPKKFEKFLQYYKEQVGIAQAQDEAPLHMTKKAEKAKNQEKIQPKGLNMPPAGKAVQQAAPEINLLDFADEKKDDGFEDFVQTAPA